MKKAFLLFSIIFLLFVSCDSGAIRLGNTSTVNVQVAIPFNIDEIQDEVSRAMVPMSNQTITITASGPNLSTVTQKMTRDLATNTFSGSLILEKEQEVTFTIEAEDSVRNIYARGSATKLLMNDTEDVEITLVPNLENAKHIRSVVYGEEMLSRTIGEVSIIVLELGIDGIDLSSFEEYLEGVDFSRDISFSYKVLPGGIAVMVCDRDGNVLLDKDNKWNMKIGDEVVIMYAKTAVWGAGFGVAPAIVLDKIESIQQVKDFLENL
jgi:hypothetical protein